MSKLVESLRWLVKPQNLSPKEQKDRRKVVTTVVAGTAMLAVGGVAACAEIIKKNSNEATATEPTSDQGNGNGETATSALTEVIETKVPSGTLPPPEFKIGAGGAYTEAQKKIIESDLVIKQQDALTNWLKNYWGKAENAPFNPSSAELNWKFVFDDPNSPIEAGVLLEAGGEYQGRTFYLPIKDGIFMQAPPKETGTFTIPEGFGPLEVSSGGTDMALGYRNSNWVRMNGTNKVLQFVDHKTGEWVGPSEFSASYPVVESSKRHYVGNINGVEVPIDIALDKKVDPSIKAVELSDVMVTAISDNCLRAEHYRYSVLMNHPEVAKYEDWLETLKVGGGFLKITLMDETTGSDTKVKNIDERQGFSMTLSGIEKLPISLNRGAGSVYVATESSERMLSAAPMTSKAIKAAATDPLYGDETLILGMFNIVFTAIGVVDEGCLTTIRSCNINYPAGVNWSQLIQEAGQKRLNGDLPPLVTIVR